MNLIVRSEHLFASHLIKVEKSLKLSMSRSNLDCFLELDPLTRKKIRGLCAELGWEIQHRLTRQNIVNAMFDDSLRESIVKGINQSSELSHQELGPIRNHMPLGTDASSSPIPPFNCSSAPLSTPTGGKATEPIHIDLDTSKPSPFRIDYDPHFQMTQVNAHAINPTADVPRGGSAPRSGLFTFAPPSADSGPHTTTFCHQAQAKLTVARAPIDQVSIRTPSPMSGLANKSLYPQPTG